MNQQDRIPPSTEQKKPLQTQIAIESIGKTGSLAVLVGETVIWSRQLPDDQRTAAVLAVHLQECLQWCREASQSLDFVSVAVGPGSFTGLRIGITTAKTLGYAFSLPIVPVGSLAVFAASCTDQNPTPSVIVGLNAYRGQVFTATFSREELSIPSQSVSERAHVVMRDQWEQQLSDLDVSSGNIACGDTVLFSPDSVKPCRVVVPHAVGVGQLAARLLRSEQGRESKEEQTADLTCDAFSLSARYLKLSAAEEKAAQR